MKETTRTIQIKVYTDDEGKPVCGECVLNPKREYCQFRGKEWPIYPGPSCPVWHGESKGEWQPIETAPKDGTEVLVSGLNYGKHGSGRHVVVAAFKGGIWKEDDDVSDEGLSGLQYLTHWTPLPSPPQENNNE